MTPENPGTPDSPEVLEAHWSREQVLALFADLARCAEIKRVQVRANRGQGMNNAATTLAEAERTFADGVAKAIQIHYEFDHQSWCDTLMVFPDHIRVIRAVGRSLEERECSDST